MLPKNNRSGATRLRATPLHFTIMRSFCSVRICYIATRSRHQLRATLNVNTCAPERTLTSTTLSLIAVAKLTVKEKRLCAFISLGLSTKEIAAIAFREVRSCESSRNRLRKKWAFPPPPPSPPSSATSPTNPTDVVMVFDSGSMRVFRKN